MLNMGDCLGAKICGIVWVLTTAAAAEFRSGRYSECDPRRMREQLKGNTPAPDHLQKGCLSPAVPLSEIEVQKVPKNIQMLFAVSYRLYPYPATYN